MKSKTWASPWMPWEKEQRCPHLWKFIFHLWTLIKNEEVEKVWTQPVSKGMCLPTNLQAGTFQSCATLKLATIGTIVRSMQLPPPPKRPEVGRVSTRWRQEIHRFYSGPQKWVGYNMYRGWLPKPTRPSSTWDLCHPPFLDNGFGWTTWGQTWNFIQIGELHIVCKSWLWHGCTNVVNSKTVNI